MADQLRTSQEAVIKWIDQILGRKSWTGTDLARKCGLAPSTVLRLRNDPNHRFVPSLKTLQKIADGSGCPIPAKVTRAIGAARMDGASEKAVEGALEDTDKPLHGRSLASSARGRSTVQLRHVTSLPSSLRSQARPDVAVACPPQLESDHTAFAFYMPDPSLDPWVKSGTLLYGTQRRDPMAGDLILVTDRQGRSRVRLLVSIDERGLMLGKAKPPENDGNLAFDDIEDIAVVAAIVPLATI